LDAAAQAKIKLLDEAHAKFWHRYPRTVAKPVVLIDQIEPDAEKLLRVVGPSIRGTP
jgi:hypothetical protein